MFLRKGRGVGQINVISWSKYCTNSISQPFFVHIPITIFSFNKRLPVIPICPSQSQSHVLHQALAISCHNDARLSLIKIIKQLIQTKDWHSHKYPTFPFVLWVEGPDHNVAKKQPFSSLSLPLFVSLFHYYNCFLALFFLCTDQCKATLHISINFFKPCTLSLKNWFHFSFAPNLLCSYRTA